VPLLSLTCTVVSPEKHILKGGAGVGDFAGATVAFVGVVGRRVGWFVVGFIVGFAVGFIVGFAVGFTVGFAVGFTVGLAVVEAGFPAAHPQTSLYRTWDAPQLRSLAKRNLIVKSYSSQVSTRAIAFGFVMVSPSLQIPEQVGVTPAQPQ
jgi:hypothetical protein